MKRHVGIFFLALAVVAVLLVSTVAFTVDELKDIVLVKTFGKITRIYQGHDDAGIRFKWPWPVERLVRYDARTFTTEDPYTELPTLDQHNILLTVYCSWHIADPEKFHKALETEKLANDRIRGRLQTHKTDVISNHPLEDLVNTDPKKMKIPQMEDEILQPLKSELARDYGVEVESVGLKRLGLPESVSEYVINAQKKEQEKKVQRYKAAGEAEATAIRARADRASQQILAFTEAKALKIRAEGDSAAARYYGMFSRNERLAMFLRSLDSLKTELSSKAVILLDGSEIPAVRFFRQEPSLDAMEPPTPDRKESDQEAGK
jgi:membrane protease subunit HflC